MNGERYRIVVGVDGTDGGERALAWAIDEARLRDAELTALFAWQTPLVSVPGAFSLEELERQARRLLAAAVAAADPPGGLSVTQMTAQGDPVDSLVKACEKADADLLVLGSGARRGVTGVMFGSVGLATAVRAPCPVLIVKSAPVPAHAGVG